MKLLFTNDHSFTSEATRILTYSRWSHVAVIDGINVIEAVPSGVRTYPLDKAIIDSDEYAAVEFPIDDEQAFIELVRSQIGKPYDKTAIMGFLFRRDWQDESKWFCSELPAWASEKAGQPFFRSEAMHRITPEHWWILNPNRRISL